MTIKFLSLYKGYEIKSDTWKCSFLEKSVKKKKSGNAISLRSFMTGG